MPPRTVTDQRVLITGAASGIGRATAVACARNGARLCLTDINQGPLDAAAQEIRDGGGTVELAAAVDVADHAAVQARWPSSSTQPRGASMWS